MAALLARIELVHKAICAGTLGHIEWKDSAYKLVLNSPELHGNGLTPVAIKEQLRQFVINGNTLTERHEIRQEYCDDDPDDPFWYRAIIPVPMFPKGLFVEVKLIDDSQAEPWIRIVSAHQQH
jgi:hypothetical protein